MLTSRSRRVRSSIGLFALLVAAAASRSLHIQHEWERTVRTGEEMERRVEEALAGARPVLHDDAVEGEAWPEYERAMAAVSDTWVDEWQAYLEVLEGGGDGRAERDHLIDAHGDALAALLRGAKRTHPAYPMRWEQGLDASIPKLVRARALEELARFAAHEHMEEGQPELAVDYVLASMQFGRDLTHAPNLICRAIGGAVLPAAARGACLRPDPGTPSLVEALPTESLERLVAGIRTLEAGFRRSRAAFEAEVAVFVREVRKPGREVADLLGSSDSSWRHLFSDRLVFAEYVRESASWNARHRAIVAAPWPERRALMEAEVEEASTSTNPFRIVMAPSSSLMASLFDRGLLALRFARMAADERFGRMSPLPDPFGEPGDLLVATREDGSLRIASRGPEDRPYPADWIEVETTPLDATAP